MKLPGPQVISQMRDKLQFEAGRHLYGVLGTYAQLNRFSRLDLAESQDANGNAFPRPVNLNRALLSGIDDGDLRDMVDREARRPQWIAERLNDGLNRLLQESLSENRLLVVHQIELMFAYNLDFSILRRHASNQNQIILLLPGTRRGEHIILFHESDAEFQRNLPANVIADNHLWELSDE